MMIKVGEFETRSGSLRITDPCYDRNTRCAGVVEDCVKGQWEAFIEKTNVDGWGNRVSKLIVRASDHTPAEEYETLDIDVGVDSGQAGVFDEEMFGHNMSKPHPLTGYQEYSSQGLRYALQQHDEAHVGFDNLDLNSDVIAALKERAAARREELIRDIEKSNTPTTDSSVEFYKACCDKTLGNLSGGTVEYGAVSRSGLGDGSYTAYAKRTTDGKVCEIMIDFLGENDESEFEEQ